MVRPKYKRKYRFQYEKVAIYDAQWEVLELLEPGWLFLSKGFCHFHTRNSLINRGWIEVRFRDEYLMARLTKAGREVRDGVYVWRARKQNPQIKIRRDPNFYKG